MDRKFVKTQELTGNSNLTRSLQGKRAVKNVSCYSLWCANDYYVTLFLYRDFNYSSRNLMFLDIHLEI